ncbi:MAG: tRNA uridine-5-carboxymethylaminomethyl(34) synthesis GTPase MnmE [Gammaproteobacteria bacterium]|jgi:tRNA modification GTPase|nr:tRNA uridine-5-carboxymethylaminomethyl(34) synthesis GTPase MnmE [Gammaproteobacteria bacterium]
MSESSLTIAGRATPPGRGGIAVIRVSGPAVRTIAGAVLGRCPQPRHAELRGFLDAEGQAIDTGIALFFPAPDSYTGEDVLELQCHGGVVVTELLLERVLALGARMARPGEFSERAFLNDKLDLLQAEAIADLIDAGSRAAARAAQRSLQGDFSAAVLALNEEVTGLRIYIEAAIDFPDEEIELLGDSELQRRIAVVAAGFAQLEKTTRQGCLLRDGLHVVLAGRPNSGKSSLFNALAGYAAAIVTSQPGTTRDLVREQINIDGLPLHIVDTAGLRAAVDPVEQEGVARTRGQLGVADLALLVIDASEQAAAGDTAELLAEFPPGIPVLILRNKIDLCGEPPGAATGSMAGHPVLCVSALTGAGIDELRQAIKAIAGFSDPGEGTVIARQRHLDTLQRARAHFEAGRRVLAERQAGELFAEELLQVQNALAEITGEFSSDDLLGKIFSSFCIGK